MTDRLTTKTPLSANVASIYKTSRWVEYIFEYIDAVIDYKFGDGDIENVQRLRALLLIMAGNDDNRRAMLSDRL